MALMDHDGLTAAVAGESAGQLMRVGAAARSDGLVVGAHRVDEAVAIERGVSQARPVAVRADDPPAVAVTHEAHVLPVAPPAVDVHRKGDPQLPIRTQS